LGTISILTGSHLFPVGRAFQVATTLAAVYLSLFQPSPLPPPLDTAPGNPNKNTSTTTRRHQVTSPPKQNPKRHPPPKNKKTQNQISPRRSSKGRERKKNSSAPRRKTRRREREKRTQEQRWRSKQRDKAAKFASSQLELLLPQTLDVKGMKTKQFPDS